MKHKSMSFEPSQVPRPPRKISATENQVKVIKDKYLREAPSIEAWLEGVARNIAYAEMMFAPEAEKWGLYEGVSREEQENAGPERARPARSVLFHQGLLDAVRREANFSVLIKNLDRVYARNPAAKKLVNLWASRYLDMLSRWDFLPNSPTLMNAGRDLQQLSACYVLPVPDSMEGINKALSAQALIQKSGGGTGFSFSSLRPRGDLVKKTSGVASGALSFMQLYDKMTDVVKQGGTRRGANMGILHYTHPEIKDFITMKSQPGVMENFNVSVAIDAKFMEAAAADAEYDLINPRTKEICGRARAKEVLDLMIESAWKTGDPGFIVIDRINSSGSNPTPAIGQIESTNPCGEQPLLPWEPCNLGSINLANFVEGEIMEGKFNFKRLAETVALAVRFLDDVIEVNNYPLPEIERLAKGNRRIGLGVMGYGEALVKMGVAYDSQESMDFAARLMRFVNDKALEASEALAEERGVFPNWKNSIYDPKSVYYRGEARTPRHCARTTIAPTGTIAIAAGLQGSGIEPFFAIAYTRYNAKALDAIKKGETPADKDVFFEVNPLFKEVAQKNNYFGMKEKALWARINDNHKSVRGIAEIPAKIQKLFASAHDVTVDVHVHIQAAFQKHTDNGVSKTINLANSATTDDVRKAYTMAYEAGCKGITIYRDGSKSQQVLNIESPRAKTKKRRDPNAAFGVSSEYFQIKTGYGPLHIHINYDERGPYQVFTNIPPLGTEISALTSLVGILLSKYFAEGGDPLKVLKHLNSVKGDKPIGFGEGRVNSIAHAISIALREHLKKTGWIGEGESEEADSVIEAVSALKTEYCPKCYSSNVSYESGCSGPTCHDCGFSECS
ncbi:MAG TPA: adenosylcobalamin-dependent ribonucleoside-diphosphate reductase [Elusimicrobiota bacterium]|nr:adenosylcobalamin-dependent ribonucleoside-diphosphate reductase [Elusimicrobiota bacterium]